QPPVRRELGMLEPPVTLGHRLTGRILHRDDAVVLNVPGRSWIDITEIAALGSYANGELVAVSIHSCAELDWREALAEARAKYHALADLYQGAQVLCFTPSKVELGVNVDAPAILDLAQRPTCSGALLEVLAAHFGGKAPALVIRPITTSKEHPGT